MEIFGLAIIVILIVLGMLFVVRFVIKNESPDHRAKYIPSALASNTVNSFLYTTSKDCSGTDMATLMQDCAKSTPLIYCGMGGIDSCTYLRGAAEEIFNATLERWNYKYYFTIKKKNTGEDIVDPLGSICVGSKRTKLFPIALGGGESLEVKMEICT